MRDLGRGRALRIAFLVEDGPRAQEMLDEIFEFCQGLYGGRLALMVPCPDGQISAAYWRFLQAFDPDIVYSYVPLPLTLQQDIHERLYPSELIEHRGIRDEQPVPRLRPDLGFQVLGSTSLLPLAIRPEPFRPPGPVSFVDLWQPAPTDRFLVDNFGFRSGSTSSWGQNRREDTLARPLYYYPDGLPTAHRALPKADDEIFATAEALIAILRQRRVLTMARLSAMETRRLEYNEDRWRHRFVVLIGDSFADRIAFWNVKHLQPAWLDGQLTVLRTTAATLALETFSREVGALIELNNHFGHNNSRAELSLLSYSHTEADLDNFREQLRTHCPWSPITRLRPTSLDYIAPSADSVRGAHEIEGGWLPIGAGTAWQELRRTNREISVPACPPAHCELISPDYDHLRHGWWPIDCSVVRTDDLSPYSNEQDHWQLPRRLRMLGAICKTLRVNIGYSDIVLRSRVGKDGLITVWGSFQRAPFVIDEPSDEEAFRYGLVRGRDWWPHPQNRDHPHPVQIAKWTRSSDKARYLTGVLHLFGGLHEATEVLLHEFWMRQFERLGTKTEIDPATATSVANRLKKRFRGRRQLDPQDPEVLNALAGDSLRAVRAQRRAPPYLDFDDLRRAYDEFSAAFMRNHPEPGPPDLEYDQRERESLVRSIQSLCRRQVLHQGYEWLCERCMARNWAAIERLSRELECIVCGTKGAPPVDRSWGFRLNEFVLHALRDQGTLPLLWTLQKIQRDTHQGTMLFLGPTELFFGDGTDTADAELDLLISMDGKLILCEVKSSDRAIDLDKFAQIARRVRPDITLLSVVADAKSRVTERVEELRGLVEGVPTEAKIMLLDRASLYSSPWLPELD